VLRRAAGNQRGAGSRVVGGQGGLRSQADPPTVHNRGRLPQTLCLCASLQNSSGGVTLSREETERGECSTWGTEARRHTGKLNCARMSGGGVGVKGHCVEARSLIHCDIRIAELKAERSEAVGVLQMASCVLKLSNRKKLSNSNLKKNIESL
jgi:hypothetical protein